MFFQAWAKEESDLSPIFPIYSEDHDPYCSDINCTCHYDVNYHEQVTSSTEVSSEEYQQALAFYGIGA